MSRNVLIVTNEPEICDAYFTFLYQSNPDILKVRNHTYDGGDCFARWQELGVGDNRVEVMAPNESFSGIRFFRIPFAGFVYALAKARNDNNTTDRNVVVSVKEQIPTSLFKRKIFDLFINSAVKVKIDIFYDRLAEHDSNILLSPIYDDILKDAIEGKIPMLSAGMANLTVN